MRLLNIQPKKEALLLVDIKRGKLGWNFDHRQDLSLKRPWFDSIYVIHLGFLNCEERKTIQREV